ncbi:MAG TPA: hypothetical protein VM324_06700 [Egibacteraceae bacterium]|nr:hypothetical protein [Egibacteraceae bacterium]
MSGDVLAAIEYAVRGLSRRADVRAHNVANVNTPGFRAGRVDFESNLRAALASGSPERAAAPAVRPDPSLPNPSGSTVDLENEIVGMMKDNLLRDAMVNSYNAKVGMLRAAIGGR